MLLAKPDPVSPGHVTLSIEHLQQCLQRLAVNSATRERERYTAFNQLYRAVVGRLHEKLTQRSVAVQELKLEAQHGRVQRQHEVQCGIADVSQELIFEVTALRAAVARLREELRTQESVVRETVKREYDSLVQNLFSTSFALKNRFEEYRVSLYDNVVQDLYDVRKVRFQRRIRDPSVVFTSVYATSLALQTCFLPPLLF